MEQNLMKQQAEHIFSPINRMGCASMPENSIEQQPKKISMISYRSDANLFTQYASFMASTLQGRWLETQIIKDLMFEPKYLINNTAHIQSKDNVRRIANILFFICMHQKLMQHDVIQSSFYILFG